MLIQFSVQNFKTFKEKAVLSLLASNYDTATREKENIIALTGLNLRVLKSIVVFGANASGKTRLLEGLGFMKSFVINSDPLQSASKTRMLMSFKRLRLKTTRDAL